MNHAKRVLLGSILLWAILLSACGPSSTNSANTLSAIYTSAAQTVAAQDASAQATDEQTVTPMPTDTESLLTPTDSGISTPTDLPTMAISLPTSTSGGSNCNNSTYVSDVTVTDGTVMSPGQTFVKTWALQNTGSCTWDTGFTIRFFSGDQMGGTSGPVTSSVAPGGQTDVSVTLTAPLTAGTYQGNWRLADDSGITFGEIIDVVIDVNEDTTATYEDTLTPTYTAVSTSTSIPTVVSTATSIPTTVSTSTSIPTVVPTSTFIPTAASTSTSILTAASTPTQ